MHNNQSKKNEAIKKLKDKKSRNLSFPRRWLFFDLKGEALQKNKNPNIYYTYFYDSLTGTPYINFFSLKKAFLSLLKSIISSNAIEALSCKCLTSSSNIWACLAIATNSALLNSILKSGKCNLENNSHHNFVFLNINVLGETGPKDMKIYYQDNNNDCGIAVTQTLIFHFQNKEIKKVELYNNTNIKEYGLSIIDFEKLNRKYGIYLESYKMNFDEFKNLKNKEYFVLIVNKSGLQHYVIAKKEEEKIFMYDTSEGRKIISYSDLEKIYANIFIKIESIKKIDIEPKKYWEIKENKEKIISLFLINAGVLVLSIINTFLIKHNINIIYNNHSLTNLIKIIGVALIVLITLHSGEYLEQLFIEKHKSEYSNNLYKRIIKSLKRKRNSYFNKLEKHQFLMIKDHIDIISTYQSEYINKWLISSITLVTIVVFLVNQNLLFLLLFSISFLVQYIFWNSYKNLHEKYCGKIIDHKNKGKQFLHELESFLNLEVNKDKLKRITNKCEDNYRKEIKDVFDLNAKKAFLKKLSDFVNSLLYMIMFAIIAYYIYTKNMAFEHFIIANIFYSQINKSLNSIIGYFGSKTQYEYSKQAYDQLLNVDSIEEDLNHETKLPKVIEIKNIFYSVPEKIIFNNLNLKIYPDTFIYGSSGIGKSVLYRLISGKLGCYRENIYFDEKSTKEINEYAYKNIFIYQINDSYLDDFSNKKILNVCPNLKKTIIEICESMKVNLMNIGDVNKLSCGQKQLLNILNLIKYKNKIILLDEAVSHINNENKFKIFKTLIPYISSRNFLICGEHCLEISQFFKNSINLEEYSCLK